MKSFVFRYKLYIYMFLFRQKNKSTKDIAAVRLYIASETMPRVVKNK